MEKLIETVTYEERAMQHEGDEYFHLKRPRTLSGNTEFNGKIRKKTLINC